MTKINIAKVFGWCFGLNVTRSTFFSILLISIFTLLGAQPDESYIQKLTGDVDPDWLVKVGISLPTQKLQWTERQIDGFLHNSDARKEAVLSHPWFFFPVDTTGHISEGSEISLPHRFDRNRNYKSGWYFVKYPVDKVAGKRFILKLNRIQIFSSVYVNGQAIGRHFGGYTPFELDITDVLVHGDNVLSIFVYDQSASVDGNKAYNQLGPVWLGSSYSQGRSDRELHGGMGDVPVLEIRNDASIADVFIKTSTRKSSLEIEYELTQYKGFKNGSILSFQLLKWPGGEKVDMEIPDVSLKDYSVGVDRLTIPWTDPELWSPDHPNLYVLKSTLKNGKDRDVLYTRFGFREFWVEGKSFILNGTPMRLRGESTHRKLGLGEESPAAVFRKYKKLFGSNACRLHASIAPADLVRAADEAGILIIDQSSIWSVNVLFYKNGGDWFLKNIEKEFEEWAKRDRNNPSVVIWDVENEMLRYSIDLHWPWVSKLPGFIEKVDDTRPFNFSGGGWFSPDQDMASLHMQEHYTRIMSDWNGRGTSPLIMGEFWIGGRMEQRLPSSPELASVHQRYIEEAKLYEEKLLGMRYLEVAGIMPFRITLLAFPKISGARFDGSTSNGPEMVQQSPEVFARIKHSLQAETIFFWPRQEYAVSGSDIQRELVICNDGETEKIFQLSWKWEGQPGKSKTITLSPADQHRFVISDAPPSGTARLIATLSHKDELLSSDTLMISKIEQPDVKLSKTLWVYKDSVLAGVLQNMGFPSVANEMIPDSRENILWIIPEHANGRELNLKKEEILSYLSQGGNLLCLKQDQAPTWFPAKFQYWSAYQTSPQVYERMGWEGLHKDLFYAKAAPVYAKTHPVFEGIDGQSLDLWDPFDGRVSDDVFARPSSVDKYEQGNWRTLAGGARREHIGMAEMFYGKGLLLSCQLNVIENLENPQAKRLFLNMLSHLSDRKPQRLSNKVALGGKLNKSDLFALTGAPEEAFEGASAANGDLMIAFEGTPIMAIKEWAVGGGRVFVFSDSLSQLFEDVTVFSEQHGQYLASKVSENPLLYGVSSTNFINSKGSPIHGYFSKLPVNAKVLLQGFYGRSGFWRIQDAGPVMVSIPLGKGELILSTLSMDQNASPSIQEFLGLILTNAGVEVPYNKSSVDEITIKKTVPLSIDGKLNEWLEDMEDRNVTQFIHAQPIYLSSESIVEGPPEFDLNLSAINYFLWDEQALYIAGVVFSEERTYETGIGYGSTKKYTLDIKYNKDVINLSFDNNQAVAHINGKKETSAQIETGHINSKSMTDATLLQFNYILASGKIASVDHLEGESFELRIPWELLSSKSSQTSSRAFISIESRGSKIQVPFSADPDSEENWLNLKIAD